MDGSDRLDGVRVDPVEDGSFALQVSSSGDCPQCGDHTSGTQWLWEDVVGFVESNDDEATRQTLEHYLTGLRDRQGTVPRTPNPIMQEMTCRCVGSHDGRPESAQGRGCGAYWTLIHQLPPGLR